MKIKELIHRLSKLDAELEVVLSCDEEGNRYAPLNQVDTNAVYNDESVYLDHLTPGLKQLGYTDEDCYSGSDGIKCVVLYPE